MQRVLPHPALLVNRSINSRSTLPAEVALLLLNPTPFTPTELDCAERLIELCVKTRRSLLLHPNATALLLHFFPRHLLLDA
jgi:hypothetical protein